jgi:hypothetical protein
MSPKGFIKDAYKGCAPFPAHSREVLKDDWKRIELDLVGIVRVSTILIVARL